MACCSCQPQRRYKGLIKRIYPSEPGKEPRTRAKLLGYIKQEKKRTPMIARHLNKLLDRQLKREMHEHVEVTMVILNDMIVDADLSLFASHAITMVETLLRRPQVQLRMLALETLVLYLKQRDKEYLPRDGPKMHLMVPAVVRMCQFDGSGGGVVAGGGAVRATSPSVRELAYRGNKWNDTDNMLEARRVALSTLHQLILSVPDVMEAQLDHVVPVILSNTNEEGGGERAPPPSPTPSSKESASTPRGESQGGEIELSDMKREESVSALAHQVLAAYASQSIHTVMVLIEKLIAAIDAQEMWTTKGTTVRHIMATLSRSVQAQHNHIIFSHLFKHLDDRHMSAQAKNSVVEVITFSSRNVHPAGPWVLEGLNAITRHYIIAITEHNDNESEELVLEVHKTYLQCLSTLAHRLQVPAQTCEVLLMVLQRLPCVKMALEKRPHSELSEADINLQRALLDAVTLIVDSAPSISKIITLPSTSQLLNTLLHASLVPRVTLRLRALKVLYSLLSGTTVWESEQVVEPGRALPKGQFAIKLARQRVAFRVDTRRAYDDGVDTPHARVARARKDSVVGSYMGDSKAGWRGSRRDWDALYHVLYHHIVQLDNDEFVTLYLARVLQLQLVRNSTLHINSVVPILFAAQAKLRAVKDLEYSTVLSCNASQMLILCHLHAIASSLANLKVVTHCSTLQQERENTHQFHPRIVCEGSFLLLRQDIKLSDTCQPIKLFVNDTLIIENLSVDAPNSDGDSLEPQCDISKPYTPPAQIDLLSSRPVVAKRRQTMSNPAQASLASAEPSVSFKLLQAQGSDNEDEEEEGGDVSGATNFDEMFKRMARQKSVDREVPKLSALLAQEADDPMFGRAQVPVLRDSHVRFQGVQAVATPKSEAHSSEEDYDEEAEEGELDEHDESHPPLPQPRSRVSLLMAKDPNHQLIFGDTN